jgi:alpha-tubulin suppressor-like RCC1 family protein
MTTNYNINNVDIDDLASFSSYIRADDGNYTNVDVIDVTSRKTVIFGQNALTNVYPIGKLGNAFNTAQGVNVPKIDIDEASVLSTMPTAVVFSDTKKSQYYIRGNFALVENNPNIVTSLNPFVTFPIPLNYSSGSSNLVPTWKNVGTGSAHTIAIQSNGTLWAWGESQQGASGLGISDDLTNRSSPTQIGNLSLWTKVTCGYRNSVTLQSNGTLWAWGNNGNGTLGQSDTTDKSFPIQIGNLSLWTQNISLYYQHVLAIQSNGTLWAWGFNSSTQLGLVDSTNRSSPVQVGALSIWTKVSAGYNYSFGIYSNGTLWAWGRNHLGQLGLSDNADRSSPVQVGNLSTWTQIDAGQFHTLALQSNGTLWSWGYNQSGNLGLGFSEVTSRFSPVQIGSLSTWTKISAGTNVSFAIQSNGTLWSWGANAGGGLGLSDTTNRSSPVQVGNSSVWTQIYKGPSSGTFALQSDSTMWVWGNLSSNGTIGAGTIFTNPQKIIYGL